jgi:guanosine-3',5'-bis(diphosphate) 3'-pyrophosphohydrolase
MDEIFKALTFATNKHRHQKRKCKDAPPYIIHPIRVAEILIQYDEEFFLVIQAALLHDTVEDTDTTFGELRTKFGPTVCNLVKEVTDDKSLPKEERKQLQIEHAPHISHEAKLIKLADKIANVEDLLTKPNGDGIPVGWKVQDVQKYCKWALAVAEGLKGANPKMDERLRELVNGTFEYVDGKTYPALAEV